MNAQLMSREDAAAELISLARTADLGTPASSDLAQTVLSRMRRRRRPRRTAWGIGAAVAVSATAAAVTLGGGDFYTATQPSVAMEPTIQVGDQAVLSRAASPARGDVVHIRWSPAGEASFQGFSRVLGLEGDVVSCPRAPGGGCDAVLVNGAPIVDPYLAGLGTAPFQATSVPDDHVFVLGDNRRNARDSRQLGPVGVDDIEGVAVELIDADGVHHPVPGAPVRKAPGDDQVIDPADKVGPPGQAPGPN